MKNEIPTAPLEEELYFGDEEDGWEKVDEKEAEDMES